MRYQLPPNGREVSHTETPVERRVGSEQTNIHSRIVRAAGWIDTMVDDVAMNIGDAVVEGLDAGRKRLMKWKSSTKGKDGPLFSQAA